MSVPLKDTLFENESLGSDVFSRPIRIRYSKVDRISLHNLISGTPEGSFLIQISNDITEDQSLVTNWVDYPGSLTSILGITQLMYNMTDITFRWIRLAYIRVNSTGNVTTNFVLVQRQ